MNFKYNVGDIIQFNKYNHKNKAVVVCIGENYKFPYKLKMLTGESIGECQGWNKDYVERNSNLYVEG